MSAIVIEYDSQEPPVYPFKRVRLRDGAEDMLREFLAVASRHGKITPTHPGYPPDPTITTRKATDKIEPRKQENLP